MRAAIRLVERGCVPEPLLRHGIRRLLRGRLREQRERYRDAGAAISAWAASMRAAPVAPVPERANEQHYELPPAFFQRVLGRRLKYSSALYPSPGTTLDEAEEAMLALTCKRADLADGQAVLELGCGWGSLTLWMAERYPRSRILAVSNSTAQRAFVLGQAERRGLANVAVLTCDMNDFRPRGSFDRVVSVEMFEHMRNWELLLERVAPALGPGGRVFLHVFAHARYAYPFDVRDDSDWMGRHFFTGGMMPSLDLVDHLELPFEVERRWVVSGEHYARTAEDWLANLERERPAVLAIFRATYGTDAAETWYQRWRVFFLACAELFGYGDGDEWLVAHQLLRPRRGASS